jgi:predicted DNA-binding transcriptional regulator AlpA
MTQVIVMTPEEVQDLIRTTVEQAVAARAALPAPKRLMTVEQVEEEYGLNKKNLERWRSAGEGPPYSKIGKRVFYQRAELEKFVEENRILTTGRAA